MISTRFTAFIFAGVCIVALAASFLFGRHVEHQARIAEVSALKADYVKGLADANKARADAEQAARDTEAKRVADMAALDANYQKELSDAKTVSDRTIADLQSGNVRLRERFTCNAGSGSVPRTAQAGTGTSSADALADDRNASAGRIVRAAAECDAQVKALQDVVRGDRQGQ